MSDILGVNKFRDSDEIFFVEIIFRIKIWLKYLLSKWLVILLTSIIGAILGFLYAIKQEPIYKAEISFVVEGESAGNGNIYTGLASQLGLDLGSSAGGVFSGENLLDLMKSRYLVEKALLTPVNVGGKTETLAEYYIDFNKLRETWKDNHGTTNIKFSLGVNRNQFTVKQDSLLGLIYKDIIKNQLIVERRDKKSSIMSLKVNSSNELFSKLFAEVLIKEVTDFFVETKTKKAVENLVILKNQTDSVRRALNSAISGVASSVDANPNVNPALQILRAPSQRKSVDVQANQSILTELVKNLEMARITLRKETPLVQIIDRPILPLDVDRYSKIKGIILGGFISGFLTIMFFLIKKFLTDVSLKMEH